eukprot:scaffold23183_cov31-Tisochrysis_lutea.AAC.2
MSQLNVRQGVNLGRHFAQEMNILQKRPRAQSAGWRLVCIGQTGKRRRRSTAWRKAIVGADM